jgi:hypothetical protein
MARSDVLAKLGERKNGQTRKPDTQDITVVLAINVVTPINVRNNIFCNAP